MVVGRMGVTYEVLAGGCRLIAATAPVAGPRAAAAQTTVRWLKARRRRCNPSIRFRDRARWSASPARARPQGRPCASSWRSGLNLADALRLVRGGSYDVVSTQVGLASRDDPFLEGIDLIGVSTNMDDLRSGRECLSRGVRQADRRALRRQGAGDLAVRPAGVLLQSADQDARRSENPACALVHAFDVEADRSAGCNAGVDPVPEVYPRSSAAWRTAA